MLTIITKNVKLKSIEIILNAIYFKILLRVLNRFQLQIFSRFSLFRYLSLTLLSFTHSVDRTRILSPSPFPLSRSLSLFLSNIGEREREREREREHAIDLQLVSQRIRSREIMK